MKGIGNDEQIVYIEIYDEEPSKDINYYEEEKNFWGKVTRKSGFYYSDGILWNRELIFISKIPANIVINNKIALEKPKIIIEYSNGRQERMYFNTEKQRDLYIKREFQGRNWRIFK